MFSIKVTSKLWIINNDLPQAICYTYNNITLSLDHIKILSWHAITYQLQHYTLHDGGKLSVTTMSSPWYTGMNPGSINTLTPAAGQ